ncbi:retrovirus-related pol polyprotein from transposon TNT 1-94 [Tanacetum coccineum]|uniref:Retrovirus-related pol polyprotein from transposon TNT 1-94 n=1 Tax=Tanacetum coccineum TaxID=301880 RepID=A0ABQ4Z7M8_9ASTR
MSSLAEFDILNGADNRPPMLDKLMYDSWKSQMELYMENHENGYLVLESIRNGPLNWSMVEENGVMRKKKVTELLAPEKLQYEADVKATNIILQGVPPDVYALVSHHRIAKDLWERIEMLMQGTSLTKQERECKLYDAFDKFSFIKGETLSHSYPNQQYSISHPSTSLAVNYQSNAPQTIYQQPQVISPNDYQPQQTEFPALDSGLTIPVFNKGDDPIDAINMMMSFLSIVVTSRFPSINNQLRNSSNPRQQATIQYGRVTVQQGEGHMAKQCPQPKRKRDASWFREKVLLVEAQGNGMVLNEKELEFLADPGILDSLVIPSVITHNAAYQAEDLIAYDSDCDEVNNAKVSLMATLSSCDSSVLSENQDTPNSFSDQENEINLLKQTLSQESKEKEALLKTVNVLKSESSELESKSLETKIDLSKKIKQLDNIVYKIGFQNPFYLKKAQQFSPKLYDGNIMVKDHPVFKEPDSEEMLLLAEESHSKMILKVNEQEGTEKKVKINPIDYANQLSEDFIKRFVLQSLYSEHVECQNSSEDSEELSTSTSDKTEVPKELPKVSLVYESLKKLKCQLASFDLIVKVRTTSTAITEGTWEFEHTKVMFRDEENLGFKEYKRNKFFGRIMNDFLEQVISHDILNVVVINSSVAMNNSVNENVNVEANAMCNKCLDLEVVLIKQNEMVEKDEYNKLLKSYAKLEQHCISLELSIQINKEIFQKENTSSNQNEPTFDQLFELNNLKAQLQAKDDTIKKLKSHVKRVTEATTGSCMKQDLAWVAKLIAENEHLKQTFKQLYDSIKPSRVHAKEDRISVCHNNTKNDLRKLKGKDIVDNATQVSSATTIAPGMYKLDSVPLAPKVKNNRESHEYYITHTMEQAAILRETCPIIHTPSKKLGVVMPIKNKDKKVRFVEPVTSSSKPSVEINSSSNLVSNPSLSSSTGMITYTSASGSKPSGNTKNDKISQPLSSNKKKKVEAQPRKHNASLNKEKSKSNVCNEHIWLSVEHTAKDAKTICSICHECLFDANHDLCLLNHVYDVNVHAKSASKNIKKRNVWKPTGKVFNSVGYQWRPTGKTLTIVRNKCPLTRFTSINVVPPKETTPIEVVAPKPVVNLVYTRRSKAIKSDFNGKSKIIKSVTTNKKDSSISSFSLIDNKLSTLFCVGQSCDTDLEVAFQKHTCSVHNLEGMDLLSKSYGTNLYTLSFEDMKLSTPICLLSKATKTKPWKWYILVIIDDYSRFTWVKFLRTKDETPGVIIKFLKMIQVRLNVPVKKIRTDNGTEFINQTLREYYEEVGISHETSVA